MRSQSHERLWPPLSKLKFGNGWLTSECCGNSCKSSIPVFNSNSRIFYSNSIFNFSNFKSNSNSELELSCNSNSGIEFTPTLFRKVMKPIVNLIHYDSHSLASTDALLIFIDVGLGIERIRQILKNRKRLALWLFLQSVHIIYLILPVSRIIANKGSHSLTPEPRSANTGKVFFSEAM